MLASHPLVGRRGQVHLEMSEELTWSDTWRVGFAEHPAGSEHPAPSLFLLLRLEVSSPPLGFPWLAPSHTSDLSPDVTSPEKS